MLKTITILSLVLFSTTLFCQWEVKNLNPDNNNTIYKIKFYNDSVGYAMGARGLILRTEDQGESWQTIETDIEGEITDFDFNDSGDIILTTLHEEGTFKSTNGFDFFEIFQSPWEYSNIEYSNNNFYLSGEETIYRSVNDGGDWEAIYNIEDNGYSWAYISDITFVNDQLGFAVGKGDPYGSSDKSFFLLKSVNSGSNWEIITQIELSNYFPKVHFIDELTGYVLTSYNTWKTIDGGLTWVILTNKYGAVDIASPTSEKLITVNRPFAYITGYGPTSFLISESNDAGATWTGEYRDGAHLETIHFLNDSIGFAAGDYSLILKTEKCGGELGEDYPWYLFNPNSATGPSKQKIEIFPNPASDILYIKNKSSSTYEYKIQTISGKILKQDYLSKNTIDINDINPGIHFLTLFNENSHTTIKIIKSY